MAKVDASGRRTAIDGAQRRRLYLFRHGAVDYFDDSGDVVPDTDSVQLNATGRAQAVAMRQLFSDVHIDRAFCSGLPRTVQTGNTILGDRGLSLEVDPAFEEIREVRGEVSVDYDILQDVAFSHWRASHADARFLGGERYEEFYARIVVAIQRLIRDEDWHNLALFAHGGTNAAILGWVCGIGLPAFGLLDQATCCLNVIDFDVDDAGTIKRQTLRALNVTAYDPAKGQRHAGDMESLASWMLQVKGNDVKDG